MATRIWPNLMLFGCTIILLVHGNGIPSHNRLTPPKRKEQIEKAKEQEWLQKEKGREGKK